VVGAFRVEGPAGSSPGGWRHSPGRHRVLSFRLGPACLRRRLSTLPDARGPQWLVGQGIKLLGIDSPGLEVQGNRANINHHILFDRGIPLIESLIHLEQLESSRVYVFALPLPAQKTDAVPLRVLAFEGHETGEQT